MLLSLRDAHRIVSRISASIKGIDPDVSFTVNPWNETKNTVEHAQSLIDVCVKEYLDQFNKLEQLHTARHTLRGLIGAANAKKLDDTIAEHRYVSDRVTRLKAAVVSFNVGSNYLTNAEALAARLAAPATVGSYAPSLEVYIVPTEHVERVKADLRAAERQLEALQDKLTSLNSSTKITHPQDLVDVLDNSGLLA